MMYVLKSSCYLVYSHEILREKIYLYFNFIRGNALSFGNLTAKNQYDTSKYSYYSSRPDRGGQDSPFNLFCKGA